MLTLILVLSSLINIARAQDVSGTLSKGGFPIASEKDHSYFIQPSMPLSKDSHFLIVRVKDDKDDFEVIANGTIESAENQGYWLAIESKDLKKLPVKGDFAVLLGAPKVFDIKPQLKPTINFNLSNAPPEDLERGYLQLGYTFYEGSLSANSSTRANSYKNISQYRFQGFELDWFLDFLPNYGITIKSFGGSVPVRSYYLNDIPSSYSRLNMRLNYRTKVSKNKLRWTFFVDSLYEDFNTSNPDEYLLSSKETSLGAGATLAYEPRYFLLPYQKKSEFVFQRFFVSAVYYPKVQVQDSIVSRGSDSVGSSRWDLGVGATFLFNLSWVPWVKRYYLEAGYNVSETSLKFSGPTQSESGGIYTVPQGGTGSEKDQYWYIQIGVRYEDFIGHLFKPRN